MLHGKEIQLGRKPFLAVNKQGFGSVYALLILQVVLIFSLLLLNHAQHVARLLQMDKQQQEAQLLVIYYVKEVLQSGRLVSDEVIDENQPIEEPATLTKTIYYKQMEMVITLDDTQALIEMGDATMQISYDINRKCILDLVYL